MVPIGSGRKEQPYAFCPVLGRYKTEQRCGYCLFPPGPAGNPAIILLLLLAAAGSWKEKKRRKIKKGKNQYPPIPPASAPRPIAPINAAPTTSVITTRTTMITAQLISITPIVFICESSCTALSMRYWLYIP